MKKPLLFCLFIWLVLLALPWTRGQTLLDWRGATVEQLSGSNPAWAPLDAPYRPEKDALVSFMVDPNRPLALGQDELPAPVTTNGLSVAPQFVSVARGSNDRDVLVWCGLWPLNSKALEHNLDVLFKRFPTDAALLAWSCGAHIQNLSLTTRIPGPLSSGSPNWSVQIPEKMRYPVRVDYTAIPKWVPVIAKARRGQKLEPQNGFWWWLEAMALLGARQDEAVWSVLKAGSSKTVFDDHSKDKLLTLRRAHLKVLGKVPAIFFLENEADSSLYFRYHDVARQVCENIMGARMSGRDRDQMALEGGRDMMLMGRLLRRSQEVIPMLVGISVEAVAMQSAALPSISNVKRLPPGSNVAALAGHPRSLLRYANELGRKDIALQITNEWNAVAKARRAQKTKTTAILASANFQTQGVSDLTIALAAGSQNMGLLLVQTLPVPLLALALLSLLFVRARPREEVALPAWTRGLGWSAFALGVLIGAQTLFGYFVWNYISDNLGWTLPWNFDFILPRLVSLLPVWAFGFAACVTGIGALWATVLASRRARGDASLWSRLRGMLSSTDERTGAINLGPLFQLIGIVGIWGMIVTLLGAWFFFPQNMALETQATNTLHDQYAGLTLALFCLMGFLPAIEFRVQGTKFRAYFVAWAEVARRFLVAHLVLTTALYLLLTVNGAYWGSRFDAEWLQANAPQIASAPK